MKRVLKVVFVAVCILFAFLLGSMYSNLDTIYTNKNFDDNVKYFERLEYEKFIDKSNDDEDYTFLLNKLENILSQENVVSFIKVDERKVIAKSTGIFKSSEGAKEYTILRVHFNYVNNQDLESEMFIYFYYMKVDFDRYSLTDVSTEDYAIIK